MPPALREAQAKRRAAADKRRQEVVKAKEVADAERAKDQELRRRRAALEQRLKDLIDTASAYEPGGGGPRATGSNSRTKSPPKRSVLDALSSAIKEAMELGVLPTLLEAAQEKLRGAEMAREEVKRRKAEAEAKAAKAKAESKNPNDEMAKMERKLAKKVGRR